MIHESSLPSAAFAGSASEVIAAALATRPMPALRKLRRLGRQSDGNILPPVAEVKKRVDGMIRRGAGACKEDGALFLRDAGSVCNEPEDYENEIGKSHSEEGAQLFGFGHVWEEQQT